MSECNHALLVITAHGCTDTGNFFFSPQSRLPDMGKSTQFLYSKSDVFNGPDFSILPVIPIRIMSNTETTVAARKLICPCCWSSFHMKLPLGFVKNHRIPKTKVRFSARTVITCESSVVSTCSLTLPRTELLGL